jgi:hypothetical protein
VIFKKIPFLFTKEKRRLKNKKLKLIYFFMQRRAAK